MKKAIVRSFEFARKRGGNMITLQDLFIAILSDNESLGTRVLANMGVDVSLTSETLSKNDVSSRKTDTIPIPSEKFRQALSNAFLIAIDLSHVYVGTEHMLLSILAFSKENFVLDLKSFGIDLVSVKKMVLSFGTYQPGMFGHMPSDNPKHEKIDILGRFSRDMNKLVRKDRYLKVWGRDAEINRLIHILSRKTKNNPILVGESGVGKTAIVQGLVQRIEKGQIPLSFKNMNIIQLDLAAIIAGSKIRGDVEERILSIIKDVSNDPKKILFIDEIHMIVGAGSGAQGSMDVANILKPYLTTGDLRVIGATTHDEYQRYFEEDNALSRRFQQIVVKEISKKDAFEVLLSLKPDFENYHGVNITEDALHEAVSLADRYITDRYFPDKVIDIIDEASSAKRIKFEKCAIDVIKDNDKIKSLELEKGKLISSGKIDVAVDKLKKIRELRHKISKVESLSKITRKRRLKVGPKEIRDVVSQWTKIPVNTLTSKDIKSIKKLGSTISKKIIGQDAAVESVVSALKRARVGIINDKRPIASFMFLGPSGVGKTELAKVIAEEVFGNSDSLIQIDMSEYMELHSVSKLIGSPPGYIGYQEGGQLTERVRRNPYSIVLFDEIEKAHPELLNILLQVMEEGVLKDSKGRSVNFRNTVIVLTSNIGANDIENSSVLGFDTDDSTNKEESLRNAYVEMKEKLLNELKDTLSPEFLNRLDDIVIFKSLSRTDILSITKLQILELRDRLLKNNVELTVMPAAISYIAKNGYSEEYGARNIRRKIQLLIENKLAEELLNNGVIVGKHNVTVRVSKYKNGLKFDVNK